FVERHRAYFPPDFLMPTFLDNHDMDRFLFLAGNDQDALRRAAAYQMRQPGPPIIYYGTEIGMSQTRSKNDEWGLEASRAPMICDDRQDDDLLAYYRTQMQLRNTASSCSGVGYGRTTLYPLGQSLLGPFSSRHVPKTDFL